MRPANDVMAEEDGEESSALPPQGVVPTDDSSPSHSSSESPIKRRPGTKASPEKAQSKKAPPVGGTGAQTANWQPRSAMKTFLGRQCSIFASKPFRSLCLHRLAFGSPLTSFVQRRKCSSSSVADLRATGCHVPHRVESAVSPLYADQSPWCCPQ